MESVITSAKRFGQMIRTRRKSLKMTQKELALAINVGERFIVELEQGKETCQLDKALRAAKAVGLRLVDERNHRKHQSHNTGGYNLDELS